MIAEAPLRRTAPFTALCVGRGLSRCRTRQCCLPLKCRAPARHDSSLPPIGRAARSMGGGGGALDRAPATVWAISLHCRPCLPTPQLLQHEEGCRSGAPGAEPGTGHHPGLLHHRGAGCRQAQGALVLPWQGLPEVQDGEGGGVRGSCIGAATASLRRGQRPAARQYELKQVMLRSHWSRL